MPVYIVDKPLGATSHDVVARARKLLNTRKVGHGGTLDPLATGVLALLVGPATRLSPFIGGARKRYLAWVSFGASTPTLDAEGPISDPRDASHLTADAVAAALPGFLDLEEQVPPQYSAVKMAGQKGYQAARRGDSLQMVARPARYHRLSLLAFGARREELPSRVERLEGEWQPAEEGREVPLPDPLGDFPSALLDLEVQAGTYVRALARDLGAALETGAFLSGLLRTSAGSLDLADAVRPDELPEAAPQANADVLGYPKQVLGEADAKRVRLGQRLPLPLDERTALVDGEGELVAIAETVEGRMNLLRVFPE